VAVEDQAAPVTATLRLAIATIGLASMALFIFGAEPVAALTAIEGTIVGVFPGMFANVVPAAVVRRQALGRDRLTLRVGRGNEECEQREQTQAKVSYQVEPPFRAPSGSD
jgi:hypothetical protein